MLSATDVTDLREAEQALHRQDEAIRRAYVDVLDAVTGGKLILLTEEQLPEELGRPLGRQFVFGAPSELAAARGMIVHAAETCFPGRIRPHRSSEHRGRGARQRGQARRRRLVPGVRPRREPAGRDQRRGPGDRLQDPAPGHARARLLHRREPRHGLHHHAAALRAGAAVARDPGARWWCWRSPPPGSRRSKEPAGRPRQSERPAWADAPVAGISPPACPRRRTDRAHLAQRGHQRVRRVAERRIGRRTAARALEDGPGRW